MSYKRPHGFISGPGVQEKGQVSIFKLTLTLITASFISGDVMCLHQLENHEPVEFGELGIDPVERDQVHLIPKIFQALTYVKI